jgi:hypothetical protein
MDFSATIDLIIKDLNEASEIIDDLKRYPGVPALQVELAKSKCRSAGDVIALLKNMESFVTAPKVIVPEKESSFHRSETEIPEKPVKPSPPQAEKKKEVAATPRPVADQIVKEEVPSRTEKVLDNTILADKFQAPSELYAEASAGIKVEKDLSDRLKAKQIKSLSDAIGISDKFLFIGSIFNGDKEAYANVLAKLDNATNIDDARGIIVSYAGGETESDAVSQLLELVKLKIESNG